MLQCVAVCYSVVQFVAVWLICSTWRGGRHLLQCVAVCCSVLQCVLQYGVYAAHEEELDMCCSVLQCVVVCCSVLQCVAVCCSVLQCVAVLLACIMRRGAPYHHHSIFFFCVCLNRCLQRHAKKSSTSWDRFFFFLFLYARTCVHACFHHFTMRLYLCVQSWICAYVHAYAKKCDHTRTHTHVQTHTHTHSHIHTHTHTRTHTHKHTTHTHTHTHTRSHTPHTFLHIKAWPYIPANAHTCMHTYNYTRMHMRK